MTLILFIIINLDKKLQMLYYSDVTVTIIVQKLSQSVYFYKWIKYWYIIFNKYMGEFEAVALILSLNSEKKHSRKRIWNYKTHYNQSKPLQLVQRVWHSLCVRYDEEKHNWKRKIVAILVARLFFQKKGNVAIVVKCLFFVNNIALPFYSI